ncbi:MAG: ABC transporter substrate-binding protein [Rhodospirillaceae bacterium]|nr:ABC transporter substrate-binding protein [Rhodospirillaceae bacterium]
MATARSLRCAAFAAALATLGTACPAAAVTITLSCSALGTELELCREGAEAWAEATGNTVELVSTPNSATDRLALYQQMLASGASDIDVFVIDVIWPGILESHLVDLSGLVPQEDIDQHFPAIVDNNTVDGRLVALPWFIDAGLLYYRTDLLDAYGQTVPQTWAEMAEAAAAIQEGERAAGNAQFWGYVFQASAYEGLTCNALEWIDAYGGGLIGDDGRPTVDTPQAIAALEEAASWVGAIAPPGVLNYTEEESRGVWQAGNAAFMRNWPYAWALSQGEDSPIRGLVGVAALPRGEGEGAGHTGALGGAQLAVSRYSEHPVVAADLVRYLAGYEEQKRRAIAGSFNPTIMALYEDPEVLAANPFFGELFDTFTHAVARPSRITGARYNEVSSAVFSAVHAVLSGEAAAAEALADLNAELNRMSRGGRW